MADTYDKVNDPWPKEIPPINTGEAWKAARALLKVFGKASDAPASRRRRRGRIDYYKSHMPRKCWVAMNGNTSGLNRGWRRLVHDISHIVYEYRFPKLEARRSHSTLHAKIEAEMVRYVLDNGWLTGIHRPPPPDPDAKRAKRLAGIEKRLENWRRKQRRANRAVAKLTKQSQAIRRAMQQGTKT